LHQVPLDRFSISLGRRPEALEQSFALVQRAYRAKGLVSNTAGRLRLLPQHLLRESATFVAKEGSEVVGSLTVTLDSPAGLPLDKEYVSELQGLRRSGARIVEFNTLAVAPAHRRTGVTMLLYLAAHYWAREIFGATHVVIGVHPLALPIYRALFGFERLGGQRNHSELSAEVLGLVHEVRQARRFFHRHYQQRMATGRTVYEHFAHTLPACVRLPHDVNPADPLTWQLPRATFRDMFIRRTDGLRTLDPRTQAYLSKQRTDETLRLVEGHGRTRAA